MVSLDLVATLDVGAPTWSFRVAPQKGATGISKLISLHHDINEVPGTSLTLERQNICTLKMGMHHHMQQRVPTFSAALCASQIISSVSAKLRIRPPMSWIVLLVPRTSKGSEMFWGISWRNVYVSVQQVHVNTIQNKRPCSSGRRP